MVTPCPCLPSLVDVRFRVCQLSCLQIDRTNDRMRDRMIDHITSAWLAEVINNWMCLESANFYQGSCNVVEKLGGALLRVRVYVVSCRVSYRQTFSPSDSHTILVFLWGRQIQEGGMKKLRSLANIVSHFISEMIEHRATVTTADW